MTPSWHLVTGEYPPARGGVSDYTAAVAEALALRGGSVHVWCPDAGAAVAGPRGVEVHRVAGSWRSADLATVDREMDATPAPRRLLVQWVPHAYGARSLNVGFCRWVMRRARNGDIVDLMVHEPALAFREGSLKQDAAAAVHRLMLVMLLRAARKVWVAVPAWSGRLRPWALGRRLEYCWLPVPSNVPVVTDSEAVAAMRTRLGANPGLLIGHFSTYGRDTTLDLSVIVPRLLNALPHATVVLLGRGGGRALDAIGSGDRARLIATGGLDAQSLSWALQACDLMVQPYPDGVSTRRGTLMAALAHGLPVVTTTGRLSEQFWRTTTAAAVVPADDREALIAAAVALANDPARRLAMASAAREEYRQRFDLSYTIDALIGDTGEAA